MEIFFNSRIFAWKVDDSAREIGYNEMNLKLKHKNWKRNFKLWIIEYESRNEVENETKSENETKNQKSGNEMESETKTWNLHKILKQNEIENNKKKIQRNKT